VIQVYRSTGLINHIRRGTEVSGSVTKPAEAGSIQPSLDGQALSKGDSHLRRACHLQTIETFRLARKIAPHAALFNPHCSFSMSWQKAIAKEF
jgi:hypothetical protein